MALVVFGINHETAEVALREKVAVAPEHMVDALHSLCQKKHIQEAIILSTCNRTEIIASCDHTEHDEILHWLASYQDLGLDTLNTHFYEYCGDQALLHMMRVACGLDSMILGEPQILGQLKSAYAVAKEAGTVRGELHQAIQHTFSYAKKVRTQTAIGENPVSVAFAAVSLSQRIFSDLSKSKALLIGAGETIDLVARHLYEKNIGSLIVANRTLTRAQELARNYRAEAILLSDIPERLSEVDIVISSTASQLPILGKGAVEKATKKRKRRPMFMVDIAVPRDIEPEVADLKDVYLYTVDDLRNIIDENRRARESEVEKADLILHEGVDAWHSNQRVNDVVPILRAFREQAEEQRDQELERALRQLAAGNEPEKVLNQLARTLTNKLIHTPSAQLRKAGEEQHWERIAEFTELFGLNMEPTTTEKTP